LVTIHAGENDELSLTSIKWDEIMFDYDDIYMFEDEAKQRDVFYSGNGIVRSKDKYEQWLAHLALKEFQDGELLSQDDLNARIQARAEDVEEIVEIVPEETQDKLNADVQVKQPEELEEEDEWGF